MRWTRTHCCSFVDWNTTFVSSTKTHTKTNGIQRHSVIVSRKTNKLNTMEQPLNFVTSLRTGAKLIMIIMQALRQVLCKNSFMVLLEKNKFQQFPRLTLSHMIYRHFFCTHFHFKFIKLTTIPNELFLNDSEFCNLINSFGLDSKIGNEVFGKQQDQ